MEKDSYSSTTTKSSFIRRSASFGNTSPFSSRGNKHIFRAYPSTLKIAELCFETTAAHSTIIWSDWLGFLPLWGTGTDFVSILPLPLIYWPSRKHYIVHRNNAQDCFGITWDQLCTTFNTMIWSQVQTITHTVLLRKQSPGASNLQRGWSCEYIFYSSTTVLNPWSEWTHCMENGESNVFSRLTLPHIESKLYMNINTVKLG